MKKLFFLLLLISFQASFAQWVQTSWKSGNRIHYIWSQDSVVIVKSYYNMLHPEDRWGQKLLISLDYGKSFTHKSFLTETMTIFDAIIIGKSIFVGGPGFLLRSDDWGTNWTPISIGDRENIFLLKIKSFQDQLFICSANGLFTSYDKGKTWRNLKNGIDSNSNIFDIIQFKNKLIMLVGSNWSSYREGLYISYDKGESWIKQTTGLDSTLIFSKLIIVKDKLILGTHPIDKSMRFYISSDGGLSWNVYKNDSLFATDQYELATNGEEIFFIRENEFYTSTNLGATWIKKKNVRPQPSSLGFYNIVINNSITYASIGNELWVSYDSANTWQPLINELTYGTVNSLASNGEAILASTEADRNLTTFKDAVFSTSDNGNEWEPIGIRKVDIRSLISSGKIILAASYDSSFITTDNGINWRKLPQYVVTSAKRSAFSIIGETIFVVNDSLGIIRSSDYGLTWSQLNFGLTIRNKDILAIYAERDKLYALLSGKLYALENLGENWELISANLPLSSKGWYAQVASEDELIVVSVDTVCLISDNKGRTWRNALSDLSLQDYNRVSALSVRNGVIYLAIDYLGVFVSIDHGLSLIPINEGITNYKTDYSDSFVLQDGYIYVGANSGLCGPKGSGVYRALVNDILSNADMYKNLHGFTISPNPTEDFITISNYNGTDNHFKILNTLGREIHSGEYTGDKIPVYFLPPGAYIVRLGDAAAMMLKK